MDWDAPGIRSRSAPMVRAAPPPSAYTPATSRVAMPAIFCTTPSAMVVRPCGVCSPSGDACAATARPDVDVVLVDGVGLLMGSPEFAPVRSVTLSRLTARGYGLTAPTWGALSGEQGSAP